VGTARPGRRRRLQHLVVDVFGRADPPTQGQGDHGEDGGDPDPRDHVERAGERLACSLDGCLRRMQQPCQGTAPRRLPVAGRLLAGVEPLSMRRPGRTLYEDMRRMESLVQASDLDWTIIRSSWLFDAAEVTDYRLADNSADGMFTARADLAASMLAQLADDRFIRKAVGVATTAGTPSIIGQIWRENITRPKRR
jgi:hypothetical protein